MTSKGLICPSLFLAIMLLVSPHIVVAGAECTGNIPATNWTYLGKVPTASGCDFNYFINGSGANNITDYHFVLYPSVVITQIDSGCHYYPVGEGLSDGSHLKEPIAIYQCNSNSQSNEILSTIHASTCVDTQIPAHINTSKICETVVTVGPGPAPSKYSSIDDTLKYQIFGHCYEVPLDALGNPVPDAVPCDCETGTICLAPKALFIEKDGQTFPFKAAVPSGSNGKAPTLAYFGNNSCGCIGPIGGDWYCGVDENGNPC